MNTGILTRRLPIALPSPASLPPPSGGPAGQNRSRLYWPRSIAARWSRASPTPAPAPSKPANGPLSTILGGRIEVLAVKEGDHVSRANC